RIEADESRPVQAAALNESGWMETAPSPRIEGTRRDAAEFGRSGRPARRDPARRRPDEFDGRHRRHAW
ncbi:MAG: hypothetical protein KDA28_15870, partial [Phycisphaerales bacterium]|nr:hypothetical protein [Phycisphaerales bacterium]